MSCIFMRTCALYFVHHLLIIHLCMFHPYELCFMLFGMVCMVYDQVYDD